MGVYRSDHFGAVVSEEKRHFNHSSGAEQQEDCTTSSGLPSPRPRLTLRSALHSDLHASAAKIATQMPRKPRQYNRARKPRQYNRDCGDSHHKGDGYGQGEPAHENARPTLATPE